MDTIDETLEARPHARVSVNGVEIGAAEIADERAHHADADDPLDAARRALVVRELLRQRAVALGLAAEGAPLGDDALDALLARELTPLPEPTRDACERYYLNHAARFRRRDIVYASHILFAVTDATPLAPLRREAEATLARVLAEPQTFEARARCRTARRRRSAAVSGNCCAAIRYRSSTPPCSTRRIRACCRAS